MSDIPFTTEELKAVRVVRTRLLQLGAKQERERLMRKLDAESISHQERGQIAVRQWARAWINEQAE